MRWDQLISPEAEGEISYPMLVVDNDACDFSTPTRPLKSDLEPLEKIWKAKTTHTCIKWEAPQIKKEGQKLV